MEKEKMLSYTKMAFEQTLRDLKRADFVRCLLTILLSIGFLIYKLINNSNYFALNIILLIINSAYLIVFIVITVINATTDNKIEKKKITQFFKWTKRFMLIIMAYLTIVSIIDAPNQVSSLSIVFAILMPVSLALQIIFDFVIYYVTSQVKLIRAGIEADLQLLTMPFKNPIAYSKYILAKRKDAKNELHYENFENEVAATYVDDDNLTKSNKSTIRKQFNKNKSPKIEIIEDADTNINSKNELIHNLNNSVTSIKSKLIVSTGKIASKMITSYLAHKEKKNATQNEDIVVAESEINEDVQLIEPKRKKGKRK
jgi:hypothetical protein